MTHSALPKHALNTPILLPRRTAAHQELRPRPLTQPLAARAACVVVSQVSETDNALSRRQLPNSKSASSASHGTLFNLSSGQRTPPSLLTIQAGISLKRDSMTSYGSSSTSVTFVAEDHLQQRPTWILFAKLIPRYSAMVTLSAPSPCE